MIIFDIDVNLRNKSTWIKSIDSKLLQNIGEKNIIKFQKVEGYNGAHDHNSERVDKGINQVAILVIYISRNKYIVVKSELDSIIYNNIVRKQNEAWVKDNLMKLSIVIEYYKIIKYIDSYFKVIPFLKIKY